MPAENLPAPGAPPAPAPAAGAVATPGLFGALLEVSLTALAVLRPRYGPGGSEAVDFAFDYLNPAGQQLLGLPEQPAETFFERFPGARETGALACCRGVLETGAAGRFELHYPHAGRDQYLRVAAQRHGDVLAVSLAAADPGRRAAAGALPARPAAEETAHAAAESRGAGLMRLLEQAPVAISIAQGPGLAVEVANPAMLALWGKTREEVLGKPVFEALPEARGQGFEALLAGVLATGTPVIAQEQPVQLLRYGRPETPYFNFIYQPLRDEQGQVTGVITVAAEVTEQVRAREQAELLNAQLRALAGELEARVAARTEALATHAEDARRARADAERARARLERFLGQTQAAICILRGPEHRYEYVNPAYQQVFPGRVLLGRPAADVHPQAVVQGLMARLDHVYRSGESFAGAEVPLIITPPDGELPHTLYFTFSYDAYQEDGQVAGVAIFAQDVTGAVLARRRHEALQAEALAAAQRHARERETLYQVFAQTPAAVLLLRGPAHRYEYYNAAYERLFPGRLPGSVAEALPAGAAPHFVALLDRVYQTGEAYAGTEVPLLLQAPGEPPREAYYNLTCQAFREDGQTAGVTLFAYDVTEQVLARRAHDTQRQELEQLFMQAPVAIVVGEGPDLVFQLVNPAYQRVFPGRVLLGRPFLEAMPELADTPVPGLLRRVYDTGEPYVAQEMLMRMARHEGGPLEDIYWNFTYQARRNAQGAVDGVRVFAHDVTEQVLDRERATDQAQQALALAQALTATNRQLTRVNQDLDAFIYTASHDLKQPIANIEALLDILRQQLPAAGPPDALLPRLLGLMQGAVERFQLTIAQLTDVSKLQRAQVLPAEAVDLAALVEDVRLDLAPVLAAAGAHLAVDVAACPSLSFAPRNLRSIVYNLLSNAVKYRHPARPPVVALRAHRTGGTAVLEVQDNGLGLSEAQQAKLFGLFQRLHTHVEGSGLGLYMVKKIVDNAGGTVAVQSAPGVGTTFTVALPG